MTRSPLKRKTALRCGPSLSRSPLRRVSPRQRKRARAWAAITHQAILAAGGVCQLNLAGCTAQATEGHHRKLRSQGGTDTLKNCVAACHRCHQAAHRNVAASVASGAIESRKAGAL